MGYVRYDRYTQNGPFKNQVNRVKIIASGLTGMAPLKTGYLKPRLRSNSGYLAECANDGEKALMPGANARAGRYAKDR